MGKKLTDNNRLSVTNPELCKEWDFEKNFPLLPDKVSFGSHKKAWWVCKVCSYSWKAFIANRAKKVNPRGCPACTGKVVTDRNRLALISRDAAASWDYDKNFPLKPEDVSYSSSKRVFWKCKSCGYCWSATINRRTIPNSGCSACLGKVVTDMNRLSEKFPDVASEWDYEKNYPLSPSDVSFGSGKSRAWVCNTCGCSWLASVDSRTSGNGCPDCNKILQSKNRIADSAIKNNLLEKYPTLCEEWSEEKNAPLGPKDVACCSNIRVWWVCKKCQHHWAAIVANRTNLGRGCPVCAAGTVSAVSQVWLDYVGVASENREVWFPELGLRVDGFDPETNTVFEFLGDFWHGNPAVYVGRDTHPVCNKTYGELFDETIERLFLLRRSGYNLKVIWEEDFYCC